MARNNYMVSFTIKKNSTAKKRRGQLVQAIKEMDASSFKVDDSVWFVTYGKGYVDLASRLANFINKTDSLLVCSLGQRVALYGKNLQLSTQLKYKFGADNVTPVQASSWGQHGK